jgi:hypothetical protein
MIKCIECYELLNIVRDSNVPPCRRHRSLSVWILIISAVAFSWVGRRGYIVVARKNIKLQYGTLHK